MNACLNCKGASRNEAGICEKLKGSDELPVLCVGPWAENKHYFLNKFCAIFATGMKGRWKNRYYVDLFSGPGLCINNEKGEEVKGSPLIAVSHPFTDFIFVESNKKSLETLKARIRNKLDGRHVEFIHGDINKMVEELLGTLANRGSLFFAFVDPFNIQLKMNSLEKLSKQRRLDLLLHFPYGTYLQRVLSQSNLSEATTEQIDAFFGDTSWRSLCNDRTLKPAPFLDYYEKQLKKLGYFVGNNFPNMKNRKRANLQEWGLVLNFDMFLR